jgi:hypothetical protein
MEQPSVTDKLLMKPGLTPHKTHGEPSCNRAGGKAA